MSFVFVLVFSQLSCIASFVSLVPTTILERSSSSQLLTSARRFYSTRQNTKIHVFDKIFEEEGFLGKGITVGKVQIALMSPDRSQDSIFGLLDQATRSSDDSSEGLAETCHDICMSLLRKQQDWISASSDSRWFKADDAGKAESLYNEWSNIEAARFEKEYLPTGENQNGGPTIVVVSIVLEIEGDNTVFERAGYSRAETQKVLTSIASDVLVDEGQVVNAFEVFWTPGDGKEVLTKRDVIVDFPELIDL